MSMTKALALGLMIPLALAVSDPAAAQQRGGPQMVFEELDLDGNGQISLEEMTEHRDGRFERTDANGDGSLSRDELLAAGQARVAAGVDRLLERADTDGDGALSEAEMTAMAEARDERRQARMFERIDADGDGSISESEFEDAAERMRGRHGHGRDRG